MQLVYDINKIRTDHIISSTTEGWNRVYKEMQEEFEAQRIINLKDSYKQTILTPISTPEIYDTFKPYKSASIKENQRPKSSSNTH